MAIANILLSPYVVLLLGFTLLSTLYSRRHKRATLPDVPWINRDPGVLFSKLRARLRTTLDHHGAIQYAYKEVRNTPGGLCLPVLTVS